VQLVDWQNPRPNMTRLAGVTLAEPGDADPLLKLTGVESYRRSDALILSIDELSLEIADVPALAARLEWSLARTTAAKIELHIKTLALKPDGKASAVALHQLKGLVERDANGELRLQLLALRHDLSHPVQKPIVLTVESAATSAGDESNTPTAPAQVITLDTQQNAIPVALLAPLVPGAVALNSEATFTGVVTWHANTAGDLHGRFDSVDLVGILPKNSAHVLQGTATVELTACRWSGPQFQQLTGTLTAADAAMSGSFLVAAPSYLGCPLGEGVKPLQAAALRIAEQRRAGREPAAEDESLLAAIQELSHLACRFDLDAAGLAIEPLIPAASTLPAGTLAASKDSSILFCPPLKPPAKLPAVAWLQFIASPPGAWIPFTPATLETARRLPTPQ
jgi:hypothetical protein